jgi:hypothetical protein
MLDELRAMELEKRSLEVGSQPFVASAIKAADQGRLVFRWTQLQLEMAQDTAARLARGEQAPNVHLVEVIPRPIDCILAKWREARLRLEIARPGSPEASNAVDDIEKFREEYQTAHIALVDSGDGQT